MYEKMLKKRRKAVEMLYYLDVYVGYPDLKDSLGSFSSQSGGGAHNLLDLDNS